MFGFPRLDPAHGRPRLPSLLTVPGPRRWWLLLVGCLGANLAAISLPLPGSLDRLALVALPWIAAATLAAFEALRDWLWWAIWLDCRRCKRRRDREAHPGDRCPCCDRPYRPPAGLAYSAAVAALVVAGFALPVTGVLSQAVLALHERGAPAAPAEHRCAQLWRDGIERAEPDDPCRYVLDPETSLGLRPAPELAGVVNRGVRPYARSAVSDQ